PMVLLAIMQCGAIYVPLDPSYPTSRLEFMLGDSEAKMLITNEDLPLELITEVPKIVLSEDLKSTHDFPSTLFDLEVDPEGACYILYTSGSTGKPKGVTVTHKNLVNLLISIADNPGITEADKLLAITTISFD